MTPLSYHVYSVSGSSSQQCPGIPLKASCLILSILFLYKKLFEAAVIKVPINQYRTHMTFSHKIQAKTFYMAWHVIKYARYVTLMCQSKESNKRDLGRVVINISVHLVLIYTLAFSNVLLVLALSFMVHGTSYCKCSYALCQMRTFLLFRIWTHPLQMREYLLRYAGTDRNKQSHYICKFEFEYSEFFIIWRLISFGSCFHNVNIQKYVKNLSISLEKVLKYVETFCQSNWKYFVQNSSK